MAFDSEPPVGEEICPGLFTADRRGLLVEPRPFLLPGQRREALAAGIVEGEQQLLAMQDRWVGMTGVIAKVAAERIEAHEVARAQRRVRDAVEAGVLKVGD